MSYQDRSEAKEWFAGALERASKEFAKEAEKRAKRKKYSNPNKGKRYKPEGVNCGTTKGYQNHRFHKTEVCEACRVAYREYNKAYRAKNIQRIKRKRKERYIKEKLANGTA